MKHRHDRDLQRLRDLRRKREERALEEVTLRQLAVRQAESAVSQATGAVRAHVEKALKKEREITKGLIGRTVKHRALERARVEFEVLAHRHSDLRKAENEARTTLKKNETELENARIVYRKHRLETEKLHLLLEQRKVKHIRRETALTEASDEDHTGRQLSSGG